MSDTKRKNMRAATVCVAVVAGMVGMAYASVPLYRLFCQVTGLGGTTQIRADGTERKITDEFVTVRFDANVNSGMPWQFKPLQNEIKVRMGEEVLAFYQATNTSKETITGTATFNVTPYKAGPYFAKIDCFCFTEQTLDPGQTVDMPVTFYVDPDMLNDVNTNEVRTITLSYTFFRAEGDKAASKQVSALGAGAKKQGLN